MKEQIILAVVVSFAAGVLVTGIAYDIRDIEAANERKAAEVRVPKPAPSPGQHVRELICAHRVAIGTDLGRRCM